MGRKLKVLVTGATGQQGGAVARALIERGHKVTAFIRSPDGAAARQLATSGAEIAAGDFDTPDSLVAAVKGADTLFLMGNSWEAGPEGESRHGIKAIDALSGSGIGHVIYTSVASADRKTGVPHFDSKYAVEQRLVASGLPFTISAPVAFMENLVARGRDALAEGRLAMALPAKRKLQQVAVADIGRFVASLAERRDAVFGRRIDIAGDELTGEEMAAILTHESGRPIAHQQVPLDVLRQHNPEVAVMFQWFDRVGYSADIEGLRREFPEVAWHRFDDWAKTVDWSILDAHQAAE